MRSVYQRYKKAQSVLAYALVIVVVIGALIAVQSYFKRGMQGGLKWVADNMGEQFSPIASANSNFTTTETIVTRILSDQTTVSATSSVTGSSDISIRSLAAEPSVASISPLTAENY